MWSFILKFAGTACLMLVGGLIGVHRSKSSAYRAQQLQQVVLFLQTLKQLLELHAGNTVELLEKAAQISHFPLEIKDYERDLPKSVQKSLDELHLYLKYLDAHEWVWLEDSILQLCRLDSEQSQQQIRCAQMRIQTRVPQAITQAQIQQRICKTTGLALGAGVALLLL